MNELMVVYEGGQWTYFRTEQEVADEALTEYEETLDNAGINSDNMNICEVVLRNKQGENIDSISFT